MNEQSDPMDLGVRVMAAMMSTLVFVVAIVITISYYQNPKPFIDYNGPNIICWYWLGIIGLGIASGFLNYIMIKFIVKSLKKSSITSGENRL